MAKWFYHMRLRNGTPPGRIERVKAHMLEKILPTEEYLTHPQIREGYEEDVARFEKRVLDLDVPALLANEYKRE